MKQSIDECRNKKRKAQGEHEDSNPIDEQIQEQVQQPAKQAAPAGSQKGKKNTGQIGNYFIDRTTPGAQPTIKSVLKNKDVIEKCDLAISKWMIDSSVPFNAVNSTYYQPMIDVICSMGTGYKAPNFHRVRRHL